MNRLLLLTAAFLFTACGPSTPPGAPSPSDREVSATRPIEDVPRRTIGFLEQGIWISNEFSGGRVSDTWADGDSVVVVHIGPENAPINNSAWYAFRIWADAPRTVRVRLSYEDGVHRYWPKLLQGEDRWMPLDSSAVEVGPDNEWATLTLEVGPDTLTVAGQEMLTQDFFQDWVEELAAFPHVSRGRIGTSARGRPLELFRFGSDEANRHVVLVSRQHPPEVTGTLALVSFVEELVGDSPLAREFREHFQVHVVPLMNPDGVELGHWRHNTGGVDLNRDWVAFHQPETRAVRDEVTRIMQAPGAELWFAADFHSTRRDVFYTLERSLETDPPDILDRWIGYLEEELPHYEVADGPSGLQTPMSRNWFYREFGAPGLIYEVGDDTDRDLIRQVAETAARGTMEILLDELQSR
jgi:cytosolic carboxypeptidase protein 6